jgi:hypothetical protein
MRTNRANVWVSPMTDQSMKGAGFCGVACCTNTDAAPVMKNTRNSVPMNSAT